MGQSSKLVHRAMNDLRYVWGSKGGKHYINISMGGGVRTGGEGMEGWATCG